MFSSILSYLFRNSSQTLTLDEAYKVLDEIVEEQEIENEDPKSSNINDDEISTTFHKAGTITSVKGRKYVIDELYACTSDSLKGDIEVGTRVSYIIHVDNGKVNISNVELLENEWNFTERNTKNGWCNRSLACKVVERKARQLTIDPGGQTIDLNTVSSEFLPVVGDWLSVDVKCEIDDSISDLSGKIIEICAIRPLRFKQFQGVVRKWDGRAGSINHNVYFNEESFSVGYIPAVGDRIIAEVIESEQGTHAWRAIKLIPEKQTLSRIKESLGSEESFVDNIDGLEITNDVCLTLAKINDTKRFTIELCNKRDDDVTFKKAYFSKTSSQCTIDDGSVKDCIIKAKSSLNLACSCRCKTFGFSKELLIIVVENEHVGRWVTINVQTANVDSGRYTRNNINQKAGRQQRQNDDFVLRGQRPSLPPRFASKRIPDYKVPEKLWDFVSMFDDKDALGLSQQLLEKKPCLNGLTFHVYEDYFHTLLHLEEIACDAALRNYDIDQACFIRNGEYLMLEIENLSEQRPSLVIGDRIFARDAYNENSRELEGCIHKVGAKHVYIKFAQMFHDCYKGEDYTVYAVASRTTFRTKHHAISLAVRNLGRNFLFPSQVVKNVPQIKFTYDKYSDSLANKSSDSPNGYASDLNSSLNRNKRILCKLKEFAEKNEKEKQLRMEWNTKLLLPQNGEPVARCSRNDTRIVNDRASKTSQINNQPKKLQWFDKSLNYYQHEAVRQILLGKARPLPYVIFGPPGTGKTVTIVETILQLLTLMPDARILVGTPSNSAADVLALRLIASNVLKPGDLIRFVAYKCIASDMIPAKLVPYAATADLAAEGTHDRSFTVTDSGLTLGLNSTLIGRHRVTVSTCSNLGQLHMMNFPKGHFTHVVLDEAGQLVEPEAMIALSFFDVTSGQAILAGDPMQLGPVIQSKAASELGLSESYLERLLGRFPYTRDPEGFSQTDGYNPKLVTRLVYNYRSLPEILRISSKLFYNSQLKPTICPMGSKEARLLAKFKEILPSREDETTPAIVFHGVNGENYQTADSPSWFNPQEASQVFFYYNELLRLGATAKDVGIISPYVKQIKQIRSLFMEAEFEVPMLGTVEEFQGQEFNIVLLSTVRSSENMIGNDVRHSLGFLASPRRLNVAMTRAQALLIIIGNPVLLAKDAYWRSVLSYCEQNGSYCGCPISDLS